uniref:Uncharacterized protein n=1 Tax=uncultured Desulfobacterium sp. TaxID=201089 RepID=E1YLK6_9BACT|nr:unknown protein [uncultured Desulfobacterium sp.]
MQIWLTIWLFIHKHFPFSCKTPKDLSGSQEPVLKQLRR